MPIELPVVWVVVLNVAGWPVIQLSLAWLFTQLPTTWFQPGPGHAWEQVGRLYERVFGIRSWKDWLPDGVLWVGGTFPKGALAGTDPEYLRRFIRETWRGELCHWVTLGCTPLFYLWNPVWADLVMSGYAVATNLPCILAQRYNRLRLRRLLARRQKALAPA